MVKATPDLAEKLANYCCAVMMAYIAEGIFALDELNQSIAVLETVSYMGIMGMIAYYTYRDPSKPIAPLQVPLHKMRLSSSSSFGRTKLPLSTIALALQAFSAFGQLMDMTFGRGRDGYLGDMSRYVVLM